MGPRLLFSQSLPPHHKKIMPPRLFFSKKLPHHNVYSILHVSFYNQYNIIIIQDLYLAFLVNNEVTISSEIYPTFKSPSF